MKRLSWTDVEYASDKLVEQIQQSKFNPDYLIGITSGGLFPLAFLCMRMPGKAIFTVTAHKRIDGSQDQISIASFPPVNMSGKSALLIDEILQSGATMRVVAGLIKEKTGVTTLKTAALAINGDVCKIPPDYYVHIEQDDWIVFPWENADDWEPYNLNSKVSK